MASMTLSPPPRVIVTLRDLRPSPVIDEPLGTFRRCANCHDTATAGTWLLNEGSPTSAHNGSTYAGRFPTMCQTPSSS